MSSTQKLGICFSLILTALVIILGIKTDGKEIGILVLLLFSAYILFISLPTAKEE